MKILAIYALKYNNNQPYHIQNNSVVAAPSRNDGLYNPAYYADYNLRLNFGKRSPEDFYAQDFNKNNMPKTMKTYLNAKFDERSKIAPIQIMQEAYDDLNGASTVETIKERFPAEREPKFQKLQPANYSTARSGILHKIGEIKAMQDGTPEPLFKDGCDDLTTYLVKKIYLEGKTAKEIDKDFARDINEIYELAAKVPNEAKKALGKNESVYFSHSTMYNLGIRFPEVPFWNSFIATRDDYERTKRVKSLTGEFVNADSKEGRAALNHTKTPHKEKTKPNKYVFKRDKVKNISDTIVNSNGDTRKALKYIKHRGRDAEELTFLQTYWSQIMTLATEKIHLSEEMIYFNEATQGQKVNNNLVSKLIVGEDLTKREKTPLQAFWNANPWLKQEFSTAITDSIMQFTDAYGADGENAYFKALLKDIENVKPAREEAKRLHAQIQSEYDEMAKALQEAEAPELTSDSVEKVKQVIAEQKPKRFEYVIDNHQISLPFDLKTATYEAYREDFKMVPEKLFNTYMQELETLIKDNPNKFYLSVNFEPSPDTPDINKILYTEQDLYDFNDGVITRMETQHYSDLESCRLTLAEFAQKHNLVTQEEIKSFANGDIIKIRDFLQEKMPGDEQTIKNAHDEIQKIFKEIHIPLTKKEKIGIRHKLMHFLRNYDMRESACLGTCTAPMIKLLSLGTQRSENYSTFMKNMLATDVFTDFEGPAARYLLKENVNPHLKTIVSEHVFKWLMAAYSGQCGVIANSDPHLFMKLMEPFPQEREMFLSMAQKIIHNFKKI